MKKCLLFHNWINVDIPYNDLISEKYKVDRFQSYRYCKRCEKWQKFIRLPYTSDWYDCEKPVLGITK